MTIKRYNAWILYGVFGGIIFGLFNWDILLGVVFGVSVIILGFLYEVIVRKNPMNK